MYYRKGFYLFMLLFSLTACIEREENTYTYVVEGVVKNVVNQPVQGISVVMHKTYVQANDPDTVFSDGQGKYSVFLTLTSRQRVFLVEYADARLKYRDTVRRFTFQDYEDKNIRHQYFMISDTMMLKSRTHIDPF